MAKTLLTTCGPGHNFNFTHTCLNQYLLLQNLRKFTIKKFEPPNIIHICRGPGELNGDC